MNPRGCGVCGAEDCKYSVCETWDRFPEDFEHIVPICSSCVTALFGDVIEARRAEQRKLDAKRAQERIEHEKAMRMYLKAKAKENRIKFLERKQALEAALQRSLSES